MKTWWNILICMWISVIHGEEHANGTFSLTSSPLTATDGELFTLTCSIRDGSAANIGWLQNNKVKVTTQNTPNCGKQELAYGGDIINRINESCNSTAHSIAFTFNSTTDQGAVWQCGGQVSDNDIHPRSNIYIIGTSSSALSMQSFSTTTPNMDITSDQETVTTKDVFTGEKNPNLLYIVVGAVGGAVLLTVVVMGVVCIRWRRKSAHQQNDMKEERKNKIATRVYQNTSDSNTVENDLYEGSRDVIPMNAAENHKDDFMFSDAYASVDMPGANTCTPREEVPSGDVNLENLYSKPDKSKHTEVQHDIYAEVQKPKKKKQDDPMMSEDFNTGDVYAKPNKGLKAHK